MENLFCFYYQAVTNREKTWFVNGVFRNEPNLCIERCIDKKANIFEFFVPKDMESHFLNVAQYLLENGYLLSIEKKENRLIKNDVV
ncbi:hypothetical protein KAU11_00770 [Candidatus Babeliales bacterium]|nr:hypothetical protein [Candidatus Babeliales bacterium]